MRRRHWSDYCVGSRFLLVCCHAQRSRSTSRQRMPQFQQTTPYSVLRNTHCSPHSHRFSFRPPTLTLRLSVKTAQPVLGCLYQNMRAISGFSPFHRSPCPALAIQPRDRVYASLVRPIALLPIADAVHTRANLDCGRVWPRPFHTQKPDIVIAESRCLRLSSNRGVHPENDPWTSRRYSSRLLSGTRYQCTPGNPSHRYRHPCRPCLAVECGVGACSVVDDLQTVLRWY